MAIAEDYVSPSVRWGILKQDYPQAVVDFTHCEGSEIGIPAKFGGDEEYCVASILLRPTDELPITGYKPLSDAQTRKGDHASDAWNVLCTKALGRALKRAGYADTASEMRVLVQYKQRLAEHEAIKFETTGSDSVPVQPKEEDPVAIAIEEAVEEIEEIEQLDLSDVWPNDKERDESHALLKSRVQLLPEYYQEKAREVHQGINGRTWPLESISQFNFLLNAVESLHTQSEEMEEDS
tara:strand:+ start:2310 stop:3020 length:711 start_codon:yes stop_codon:yes gene_type:complete